MKEDVWWWWCVVASPGVVVRFGVFVIRRGVGRLTACFGASSTHTALSKVLYGRFVRLRMSSGSEGFIAWWSKLFRWGE